MRSRNLKPGFFTNEVLAECEPLARLLFAGMWTIADREGRLEDRPKKIKAEILPYDNCDGESLLSQLSMHGFINRYVSCNNKYIQILNFTKHQTPHVKETASIIPAPDMSNTSTVQVQSLSNASTSQDPLLLTSRSLILDPNNQTPNSSPATNPVDNSGGVLKNGNGEGFDIIPKLTDMGLQEAKKAAPGWDIYYLASVYNGGVQERGMPKFPEKAFIAWCVKYTKGKKP